jgi:hypothetical protein
MKAAFRLGTTFANYRGESLIGRGGMGPRRLRAFARRDTHTDPTVTRG